MIVTFTPNPSLDRTIEVASLVRGAVLRATAVSVDPGGKGVNVARALAANGHAVQAVLPCGGAEGDQLRGLLSAEDVEPRIVPIAAPIRTNVSVVEPDGTVTKLNAAGPSLHDTEVEALLDAVAELAGDATWVACCGSLPPGAPADLPAALVERLRPTGARVAVDTSGKPLAAALAAGPDLAKPNRVELGEVAGHELGTVGAVVDAATSWCDDGVGALLVSLGAQGALLVTGAGTWYADTPPVAVRSAVGAGDALLAGFLAAGEASPAALVTAVAWGTAAARLPGTRMPTPGDLDLDAVHLHDTVPLDRRLDD